MNKTWTTIISVIAAYVGFKGAMELSLDYQRTHGFWPPIVGALFATVIAMLCFWLALTIIKRLSNRSRK
jgi:hypothetical protein